MDEYLAGACQVHIHDHMQNVDFCIVHAACCTCGPDVHASTVIILYDAGVQNCKAGAVPCQVPSAR